MIQEPGTLITVNDPVTPEEWQEAVDVAQTLLTIESCRRYGLVEGGPEVHVSQCQDIVARGAARGIVPTPGAIERTAQRLLHEGLM